MSADKTPALLRDIDRAAFAAAFAERLRRGGVAGSLPNTQAFVRALAANPPDSLSRLYWTARVSFVGRHSEIATFDAVFAALFEDGTGPTQRVRIPLPPGVRTDDGASGASRHQTPEEQAGGLPWMTLPPVVAGADPSGSGSPTLVPERLPSELEGLADLPFESLNTDEVELLGGWLTRALDMWPTRRTRRHVVDRTGRRVAIRPTIARARRTGWEPIDLLRVRAVRKPRPVLMLCDVSQSMQAQASAYVHLMRALTLAADAEVFAFATTLTRLTTALAHKSPAMAIERATATVTDRFGGTRIAANIRALLASHHGDAARGAVVLIGSDGWDTDPPEELAAAMARLRRRAYRVIWLNPRASAPGFEPRVAAMAAALPYCDELLPADTFRSLALVLRGVATSCRH